MQIILGQSISQPHKTSERIIFTIAVLLSIDQVTDVISKLTSIKLEHGNVEFNTVDDVVRSGQPIYTISRPGHKEDMQGVLKRHSKTIHINPLQCLDMIAIQKNGLCLVHRRIAEREIINRTAVKNMRSLQITKVSVYPDKAAFGYEKASPFAHKIDNVLQQIVESGILKIWKYREKKSRIDEIKDLVLTDNISIALIAVLLMGYSVSIIALVLEFVIKNLSLVISTHK